MMSNANGHQHFFYLKKARTFTYIKQAKFKIEYLSKK